MLAVAMAGTAMLLLLLPQRLAQRSRADGVVRLQLVAGGELRLWGQPLPQQQLPSLLRRLAAEPGWQRLRVAPAADVPWGQVRNLLDHLDAPGGVPIELELPQP